MNDCSYIQLPADGTGKKLHTHSKVTASGDEVHNQIMSIGDLDSSAMLRIDPYGSAHVRYANGAPEFDSFGKMKISQESTLSNFMPSLDKLDELFSEIVIDNGEAIYSPLESAIRLKVDTGGSDSIVRTSHKYHKYSPGTSQSILMTVVAGDQGKDSLTRQWGYFDKNDGLFFEMNGHQMGVVIRSSVSGTVKENKINRENFNGDKGDGTGISKMNIDPTKANIYWIDYQWLGVGMVRFGVITPEGFSILLHTFHNANTKNTVYMRTGSLPVSFGIKNTDITSSVSELKILNCAVLVHDINPNYRGPLFAASSGLVELDNTYKCLLTIRPSVTYKDKINRAAIIPKSISSITQADKPINLIIVKNAKFDNDGTWRPGLTNASCEYSKDLTLIDSSDYNTLGHLKYTQITKGVENIDLSDTFSYLTEFLCLHADESQGDVYSIIAKTIFPDETENVVIGLDWEELYM